MRAALLLVDFQNDFMPWGNLPVPQGDEAVEPANRVQRLFELVVATQDWHPAGHGSFASSHPGRRPFETVDLNGLEQILWPDHCVQHSQGAQLVPALDKRRIDRVFLKGTEPGVDSYSGFYDNGHRKATGLADYLHGQRVNTVYLAGLAEDVCVFYTALDARRLGFETYLITDATYGVDMHEGDVARARTAMRDAGVIFCDSSRLLAQGGS